MTASRTEVETRADLTIWRGQQTCPACPDECDEYPEAVYRLLRPKNPEGPLSSPAMVDLHEFGRAFTDRLLTVAAEARGVGRMEAVRKYQTDPTFHAMVDTIVQTAQAALMDMEQVSVPLDEHRQAFNDEVGRLLGWES